MKKFYFIFFFLFFNLSYALEDPLPSWNEGNAKQSLLDFIQATTQEKSPFFIPLKERIVTFDQDGTLWVEQPLYTEILFAIDRIKELAKSHPEWEKEEPYQAILENNLEKIKKFTLKDFVKIIISSHSHISVNDFQTLVQTWLKTAKDSRFQKPFTELVYQPMLEVLELFRKNNFKVYIASGGGQEFIRAYSETVYSIPEEHVIGTTSKTAYTYEKNTPFLLNLPEILFVDDKSGKPEAINLFIGRVPVASFGNSDGDKEMLEWSQSNPRKTLQMLISHDDSLREYAYGPDSKIGTFSASLLKEAEKKNWIVVSMKNDWKVIFREKPL